MSIPSTITRLSYATDGVTTVFPVPIQAYQAVDFLVVFCSAAGVESVQELNEHYALAASSSDTPPKWTLTSLIVPPAGGTLQIILDPDQVQLSVYVTGQQLPSSAIQQNLDRLTQMVLRLQDQVNLSIRAPDADPAPSMLLLPAIQRALKYQGFDANGNSIAIAGGTLSASLTRPALGFVEFPVAPSEGSTVQDPLSPWGWPERYGGGVLVGDNTAAINAAFASGFKVDGRGNLYPIANTITNNIAGQVIDDLQVAVTQGFPVGNTVWVVGAGANGCIINNPYKDGGIIGGAAGTACIAGMLMDVQAGRVRINNGSGQHFSNKPVNFDSVNSGDSGIVGFQYQQWSNGDPAWATQANYTGDALTFGRADCFAIAGGGSYLRWAKVGIHVVAGGGTNWIAHAHPYTSTYPNSGVAGATASIDNINIQVDEGASSTHLVDIYQDSGHGDFRSSDVHLSNGQLLQFKGDATGGCQFLDPYVFRFYAAGKAIPYDTDIDMPTAYTASTNTPGGVAQATSFMKFYPESTLNNLASITGLTPGGGTGTLTYVATSNFPPQVNSGFFLNNVAPAGHNKSMAPSSCVAGNFYIIDTLGNTNWAAIGGPITPAAAVGDVFVATGAGSGTGVCREGYIVAGSAQSAGGAGVAIVTVTYLTGTASVGAGGTLQRSWTGNMLGLDCLSGLLPNGSHQRIHAASGRIFVATGNNTAPADTLFSFQSYLQRFQQCGNRQPVIDTFGNQPTGYPYQTKTCGFFGLVAAPFGPVYTAGPPGPAVNLALNLSGTAVGDTGSTNGALSMRTQGTDRMYVDGFSGGVQSVVPATDNYMNVGSISPANKRIATVFCVNAVSVTSGEATKTDIEKSPLGRSFLLRMQGRKYRQKIGGKKITHGTYVYHGTDPPKPAPEGFHPQKNHYEILELQRKVSQYPGPQKEIARFGKLYRIGRTDAEEAAYQADLAAMHRLMHLAHSIVLTAEIEEDLPGVRTHHGAIAEEVRDALLAEGVPLDAYGNPDHAGYLLSDPKDPTSDAHLRYQEIFDPAFLNGYHEHDDMIVGLQGKVAELEAMILKLKGA